MEITKIKTADIIDVGHLALSKTGSEKHDEINGIAVCLSKLVGKCTDSGYKLTVKYSEFFDFIDDITQRVKGAEEVVAISVPRNPTISILTKLRVLCDNSVDSIMNVETGLLNSIVIYVVRIKADCRKEYAVDYAARLLQRWEE